MIIIIETNGQMAIDPERLPNRDSDKNANHVQVHYYLGASTIYLALGHKTTFICWNLAFIVRDHKWMTVEMFPQIFIFFFVKWKVGNRWNGTILIFSAPKKIFPFYHFLQKNCKKINWIWPMYEIKYFIILQ